MVKTKATPNLIKNSGIWMAFGFVLSWGLAFISPLWSVIDGDGLGRQRDLGPLQLTANTERDSAVSPQPPTLLE